MSRSRAVRSAATAAEGPLDRARRLAAGLFPHQVEGVAFLLGRRRAILADDMGLGKTRQAVVALREAAPAGPYLVVCPASVKHNWAREIRLVDAAAAVTVVGGDDGPARSGWTVVNYDLLGRHLARLRAVPWAGIVFDEAHYLKNHTSQRSRHGRELAGTGDKSAGPVVMALTGTPLTNRPRDLFPLLHLVGHPLARSFLSFARRYCDAYQNDYGWVTDGASNLEELAVQLHGVMLRRTKEQVLCLPPKLRTWLPVEVPTDTGLAATRQAVSLILEERLGRRPRRSTGRTTARGARAQVLAHLTKARHALAAAKVPLTLDLVDGMLEQGEKVLVFSCFDEPLQRIAAHLGERAVLLTGATPTRRRQALVDRFQADDGVRVFAANIVAGGIGLNLTAARQVVFNDLDWVPANHWQAEDRAYRIGQTGTVNVTYLSASGTLDDFVARLLETKAALVGAVVDVQALGEGGSNLLEDLEQALGELSPGLADVPAEELTGERLRALLAEVARRPGQERLVAAGTTPRVPAVTEAALELLARVLGGPSARRFRVASSSRPGRFYTVAEGESASIIPCCGG